MIALAEAFPDAKIVAILSRELGWSHFVELIPLKKPLQRDFYAEMCRLERWSVRALRQKIGGMLYERTARSKKPDEVAALELKGLREEDKLTERMKPHALSNRRSNSSGVNQCDLSESLRRSVTSWRYTESPA